MRAIRQRQRSEPHRVTKSQRRYVRQWYHLSMSRKISWVSPARFEPFRTACSYEDDIAWELYEWNAHVSSALSECIHHAEVLLRNAMMEQLSQVHPLKYPWQQDLPAITAAAQKRKDKNTKTATPDAIISELTLGFWLSLLDPGKTENHALWRESLHRAFPHSPGTINVVYNAVHDMRAIRNRCAHQDSLLEHDPGIELKKILSLIEWIDPDARSWIEGIERVSVVMKQRPVQPRNDVVIIGGNAEEAVEMYEKVSAYICPAGRPFAPVEYIAYYQNKRIEPFFPKIQGIYFPQKWSKEESQRLRQSSDLIKIRIGEVIGYSLGKKIIDQNERYQVFLLSKKNSTDTLTRTTPIYHHKTGRGSAYVQYKRYAAKAQLLTATDTSQLT